MRNVGGIVLYFEPMCDKSKFIENQDDSNIEPSIAQFFFSIGPWMISAVLPGLQRQVFGFWEHTVELMFEEDSF